jgi:hypothetical protein
LSLKYDNEIENEINDSANVVKNCNSPIYGRSFQTEITLPYSSMLKIGIKDNQTSKFIGITQIDLENRFYSKCYSRCGLPQKFELNGINQWRNSQFPSKILIQQCRKWHLKKPQFKEKHLIVYDSDRNAIYYEYNNIDLINEARSIQLWSADEQLKEKQMNFLIKEIISLKILNDWKSLTNVTKFYLNTVKLLNLMRI